MSLAKIVIVGRPNVGKSSLFNWLLGRRVAIVDDQAGVTRDRLSRVMVEQDRYFELIDTGGIGIRDPDNLTDEIEHQIQVGMDQADAVLFVVDAQLGLHAFDHEIATRLRKLGKPVLCVVNKVDGPSHDAKAAEFAQLALPDQISVSTKADRQRDVLLDWIMSYVPLETAVLETPDMKVAIVGRRNVGKSTLVNALAQSDRMIVSEVPGTTRDSVDVRFELDGKAFVAIDTPGFRRRKSVRTNIDFYGTTRAYESIRRADVVLLMFDASEPVSQVDKQLAGYVEEHYRPGIFVVNKWDLYHGNVDSRDWVQYLRDEFRTMQHVPVAFITARDGKNVKRLINDAQRLFKQSQERVATSLLNDLVEQAVSRNPPPLVRNRRPKILYASQIDIQPPTLALVCNHPGAFSAQYRRYLTSFLRDALPFADIPIRLVFPVRRRTTHSK